MISVLILGKRLDRSSALAPKKVSFGLREYPAARQGPVIAGFGGKVTLPLGTEIQWL